MKATKFHISGDAKAQANFIHDSISSLDGIKAIRVDSFANTVTVDFDDHKISSTEIESTLRAKNLL